MKNSLASIIYNEVQEARLEAARSKLAEAQRFYYMARRLHSQHAITKRKHAWKARLSNALLKHAELRMDTAFLGLQIAINQPLF